MSSLLGFDGRIFEDNFLITYVKTKADFPTERWFWFVPHFKSGASALLRTLAKQRSNRRATAQKSSKTNWTGYKPPVYTQLLRPS